MSAFQRLVTENPMLIEIQRHKRRFFEGGRGKSLNTMVLVVAMVAYLSLLLVVFNFSGDVPPEVMVQLQTGVFALVAPALLYGSIAGERDRRSWDLLLVAPISHRQIVIGKFVAAMAGMGLGLALFLFPTLITAVTYHPFSGVQEPVWAKLFLQEGVSITFGLFASALTMFFSARSKRAFAALASSLGAIFVLLVVVPTFAGIIASLAGDMSAAFIFFHPHMAIAYIWPPSYSYQEMGRPDMMYGIPQMLVYTGLALALLEVGSRTLTRADGDRRTMKEVMNA